MDPVTTLAATSRMRSFWLVRELTSVLVPGLALLAEIITMFSHEISVRKNLTTILESGSARFGTLVAGVAIAWLLGYVAREFGFRILTWMTEPRLPLKVGHRPLHFPDRVHWQYESFRTPQQTTEQMHERLQKAYGEKAVADFLEAHSILKRGFHEAAQEAEYLRGGGGHLRDSSTWVFGYCKRWLRRNSPLTTVDDTEIEINIAVGALLPAVLITPTIAALAAGPIWVTWIVPAIVSLLVVLELARSFRRLRGSERWDALERTFEDWAMSQVEAQRGPKSIPPDP